MSFPEDSIQSFAGEWWVKTADVRPERGRLVHAVLPHVSQVPIELDVEGRSEPTEHSRLNVRLVPFRLGQETRDRGLPVSALPPYPGEVWIAVRAKVRPALLLSGVMPEVPQVLRAGAARWQTSPTVIGAPYYGVDQGGRGGWKAQFVERIRRCEYPQYMWDHLPITGPPSGSILRLDHVQPIGNHANAFKCTDYRLSAEALALLDEWWTWLTTNSLPDGPLRCVREGLLSLE